jgi:hypothetical protein
MPLNAQIALSIVAHETTAGDLSKTMRVTPANYAVAVADGTAANQAQVAWSDSKTLAAASESFSLSSLSDTRDGSPATVSMTAVKAAYVRNKGASSLAFAGSPFPASGITVAAGAVAFQCDPSAAGMAASGVTVTGTIGGEYEIMLIGEGTVT